MKINKPDKPTRRKLEELADALQELIEREDLTMVEREMEEKLFLSRIAAARVNNQITTGEAEDLRRGMEAGRIKP